MNIRRNYRKWFLNGTRDESRGNLMRRYCIDSLGKVFLIKSYKVSSQFFPETFSHFPSFFDTCITVVKWLGCWPVWWLGIGCLGVIPHIFFLKKGAENPLDPSHLEYPIDLYIHPIWTYNKDSFALKSLYRKYSNLVVNIHVTCLNCGAPEKYFTKFGAFVACHMMIMITIYSRVGRLVARRELYDDWWYICSI